MALPGEGRNNLWFGTELKSEWFKTPKSGADMSPVGWNAGGNLLNGGGWVRQSWGTHKEYVFEWGDANSREEALKLQTYRSGVYGKGLLYFIDPLLYDKNIFPSRWSSPAITVNDDGPSLVSGVEGVEGVVANPNPKGLPLTKMSYNLATVSSGYRGGKDSVYIPIPAGYTLYVGAVYTRVSTGGVFVAPVTNGVVGASSMLTPLSETASNLAPSTFTGGSSGSGVRVYIGKSTNSATASVSVTALTARLYKTGVTPPLMFTNQNWILGAGHSGCRFVGEPTYVANSGVDNGRISFACTFREVGDWE